MTALSVDLPPELVEKIAERAAALVAERVVDRLRAEGATAPSTLLDPAETARRFGVSRDFLYEHSERLGAIRLGDGPRARLRFNPDIVAEALGTTTTPSIVPRKSKRQRRPAQSDVELLPIRGRA